MVRVVVRRKLKSFRRLEIWKKQRSVSVNTNSRVATGLGHLWEYFWILANEVRLEIGKGNGGEGSAGLKILLTYTSRVA